MMAHLLQKSCRQDIGAVSDLSMLMSIVWIPTSWQPHRHADLLTVWTGHIKKARS